MSIKRLITFFTIAVCFALIGNTLSYKWYLPFTTKLIVCNATNRQITKILINNTHFPTPTIQQKDGTFCTKPVSVGPIIFESVSIQVWAKNEQPDDPQELLVESFLRDPGSDSYAKNTTTWFGTHTITITKLEKSNKQHFWKNHVMGVHIQRDTKK